MRRETRGRRRRRRWRRRRRRRRREYVSDERAGRRSEGSYMLSGLTVESEPAREVNCIGWWNSLSVNSLQEEKEKKDIMKRRRGGRERYRWGGKDSER